MARLSWWAHDCVWIGAGLIGSFVILDLAVTWPNYASLIAMGRELSGLASEAQRAALVAAARYATSVLESGLFGVYAILVPALGILVLSVVMWKGSFGKVTACLGLATGVLGAVAVVGGFFTNALTMIAVVTSVLTTVWVLLVGLKLLRLSRV